MIAGVGFSRPFSLPHERSTEGESPFTANAHVFPPGGPAGGADEEEELGVRSRLFNSLNAPFHVVSVKRSWRENTHTSVPPTQE